MATTIVVRIGIEANRVAFTPVEGEILYTTDLKKLYIGDGSTGGGNPLNDSASEILTKLLTVDGAGSTLDGDLVDGLDSLQIVRTDQDGTLVGELTVSDEIFALINKVVNANTIVDVFVYDTSKDSDGGAWRNKTSHTSWYNETLDTLTRGSTRKFPAVAVIVIESGKLTIYDATNSDLFMWMVFETGTLYTLLNSALSSAMMLNGLLCVVGNNGVIEIQFILDKCILRQQSAANSHSNNIALRNTANTFTQLVGGNTVSTIINDVDMTILDNAPIDTATGLPVPTVAVATDGGVSVIHNDGKIVNITNGHSGVTFNGDLLILNRKNTYVVEYGEIPYFNVDSVSWRLGFLSDDTFSSNLYTLSGLNNQGLLAVDNIGTYTGLTKVKNLTLGSSGMVNYITKDYQSGWMQGDIKGAFLSSTDSTDLVASGELVVNGTFDTDTSGWTYNVGDTTYSVVGSQLRGVRTLINSEGELRQFITVIPNRTYIVTVDFISKTSFNAGINVHNTGGFEDNITFNDTTQRSVSIVPTGSVIHIDFWVQNAGEAIFDNVSVKLADEDRSYRNNGLEIIGTVTRSAVETGAELMGYSGFSAINHLKQPSNPDLDFGTDDFYGMGWINPTDVSVQNYIFVRSNGDNKNTFELRIFPGGVLRFYTTDSVPIAAYTNSVQEMVENVWTFFCVVRRGTQLFVYVNGIDDSVHILKGAKDVTLDAPLYIGIERGLFNNFTGELSLIRIGAGAPSTDQIKEIYESEKHLFKEDTACTLNQTTDSGVQALSYDEYTDKLLVAGANNLDTFQGLVRVDSEVGVYTSVSANNNIIAKGN